MLVVAGVTLAVWVALPLTLVFLHYKGLAPILDRELLGNSVSVWVMMAAIIGFLVWVAMGTPSE
jgi:hypothetical protein